MEILVVLAVIGLGTALIMPSSARMLDQATAHAVFFEFQRQISEYRREANRTGLPIRVTEEPLAADMTRDTASDEMRAVRLRTPWRYTLAPALEIEPGGRCSTTSANLVKDDEVVMTLRTAGGDCRFLRLAGDLRRP